MDFEQALVHELSTISAIENRVFPLNAKEGTNPPFVIYVSSEGAKTQTLDGFIDNTEITCEIHVVAKTYEQLKTLAKTVIDKLQSFFGRSIGVDGVFIKSLSYIEPIEAFEEDLDYHRTSFDIRVRI